MPEGEASRVNLYDKARMAVALGRGYLTRKTLDDEYLSWLMYANAGMQNPGNLFLMDLAIRELPSKNPIIEIGSFCGLSTNAIRYLLHKHGRSNQIFAVDPWTFERSQTAPTLGDSSITMDEYTEFVIDTFRRNVAFFSRGTPPIAVRMTSDDFFRSWQDGATVSALDGKKAQLGGPVSFAYIDGNHTYEYCRRDFENTDRHLDVGGLILFDDSADSDPFGLSRLMKELRALPGYELVMKNPNYLFRKTSTS